jgi:hypothetical protein
MSSIAYLHSPALETDEETKLLLDEEQSRVAEPSSPAKARSNRKIWICLGVSLLCLAAIASALAIADQGKTISKLLDALLVKEQAQESLDDDAESDESSEDLPQEAGAVLLPSTLFNGSCSGQVTNVFSSSLVYRRHGVAHFNSPGWSA